MKTILITWLFALSQVASAAATDVKAGNQMSGMFFKENHTLNYGFEGNNKNNVTDSSSIATVSSSTPISGTYSLGIDATTSGQLVKVLGKAIKQVGSNCEADFYYSGDASLYKAYVLQSSTQVSSTYYLANVGTNVQSVNMFFPCGDGTAPDITIEATSNSAAAIKVDDFYSGQPMNIGTVAQASFVGSLKYAGATSCSWGTSSTSLAAFAADTDCATPSVVGSATAPGTKIPGVVFSNLAAGIYKVTAKGSVYKSGTADATFSYALNDGTTTGASQFVYMNTGNSTYVFPITIVSYFTYTTTQSSVTFQMYGQTDNASNAAQIGTDKATRDLEISVEYFPTSAQAAITPNQQRAPTVQRFTSGTSQTYTTPPGVVALEIVVVGGGGGGSASNSGSPQNGATGTASTWIQSGTTLVSSPAGVGAVVNSDGGAGGAAPTITSPAVTITSVPGGAGGSSTQVSQMSGGQGGNNPLGGGGRGGAGGATAGAAGATNTGAGGGGGGSVGYASGAGGGAGAYAKVYITTPATSYTYTVGGGGAGGTGTFAGGAGASGYIEVTEYYSQSAPILIGSVTSNTSGTERIERASVSCSSSASITSQSGTWISSIGNLSAGACTLTLPSGIFSASPVCTATIAGTLSTNHLSTFINVASATSVVVGCTSSSTGSSTIAACTGTTNMHVICMGAR